MTSPVNLNSSAGGTSLADRMTPGGKTTGISLDDRLNGTGEAASSSALGSSADMVNEQTFLKLLVTQIKNQNPLNPMDGTQFVQQLAQFSQLEQTIQIRQDVQGIRDDAKKAAAQTTPATETSPTAAGAKGSDSTTKETQGA